MFGVPSAERKAKGGTATLVDDGLPLRPAACGVKEDVRGNGLGVGTLVAPAHACLVRRGGEDDVERRVDADHPVAVEDAVQFGLRPSGAHDFECPAESDIGRQVKSLRSAHPAAYQRVALGKKGEALLDTTVRREAVRDLLNTMGREDLDAIA